MSKVFFGSAYAGQLRSEATLPARLDEILTRLDIARELDGKRACIKMHMGTGIGYSTTHPLFVRRLASFIKAAGGDPFVTDTLGGTKSAAERGYTPEVMGCPIIPAAGSEDKHFYSHAINYKNLKEIQIGREMTDADYLVCLSHAKGHGNSGYGGALKNLALGAMVQSTRNNMHMIHHADPYWDADKCTHYSDGCKLCVEECPVSTMRFADDQKLHVGFYECNLCLRCNEVCPVDALTVRSEIADAFQELIALASQAVLGSFPNGNAVFINFAVDITPVCDCVGFTTASLVPDIGIFASKDIVAVDKATLDSIDYRNLLAGTVPPPLVMQDKDGWHLFQRIHGKDPYVQVYAAERLGLGNSKYELEEV